MTHIRTTTLTLAFFLYAMPSCVSYADIIFRVDITETGHLLEGAVITQQVNGDFVWESPPGFISAGQYAATNAAWRVEIAGATGEGAVWNGTYSYRQPNSSFPNVGVQAIEGPFGFVTTAASLNSSGQSTNTSWTDDSKSFVFLARMDLPSASVSDGMPVVFDESPTIQTFGFASFGVANSISFQTPNSFEFSTTAVPEPSTLGLTLIGSCIALVMRRNRRARKAPGEPRVATEAAS